LQHAKKPRRASTGSSSGERHEITNAPQDRSCHDSAMLGVRDSLDAGRHDGIRRGRQGAMDARSRRLSSCPGFRPLGCTPDITTARRNCPAHMPRPACLASHWILSNLPLEYCGQSSAKPLLTSHSARSAPAAEHEATVRPYWSKEIGKQLTGRLATKPSRSLAAFAPHRISLAKLTAFRSVDAP
jgi:hypothetical protein